ncbi:MAG: hypothetical protein IJ412_01775 [Oscillospiraceae bacterium]|nr:hypothetical protein [Oscillospiraceae bacterium]
MDTEWICQRMRALKMTQKFLAQKIGLTTGGLNHKLHNRRPTTLREAAGIAHWLRMNSAEVKKHFFTF